MRRPTPASVVYAWHRAALAGEGPAMHPGWPECGWFKMRNRVTRMWMPVRIFMERQICPETGDVAADERLVADVNGRICDPTSVWTYLTPISRADYDTMLYRRALMPEIADDTNPLDLTKEPLRWMT
mgnify:CR=1 FL=1